MHLHLWLLSVLVGVAAAEPLELRELLGRDWSRQLVGFPVAAPVAALTTAGEAVPSQVTAGKLWFIADLAARQTVVWEWQPGETTARRPPTDLAIVRREDSVEVATGHFGIRLFVGERRYEQPAAAADVPAPVVALRLADGTWFGGSELYGPARVAAVSGRVIAAGPVFAEVAWRYEYADGNVLDLTARFAAGDNAVLWDADVRNHQPDSGWQLVLSEGLPELVFPVMIEFFSKRDCVKRGERAVFQYHHPVRNLAVLPLATHDSGLVTQLTPWNDWWDDYTQTRFHLWVPAKGVELVVESRDAGAWIVPRPPGEFQSHGHVYTKCMPLEKLPDGRVVLRQNLAAGEWGGVRRWTLGTQPMPEAARATDDFGTLLDAGILEGETPFPRVGRRLDEVKDMVLDWPANPAEPHPRLFLSGADIVDYRRRCEPDPAVLAQADYAARSELRPVPSRFDAHALAGWLVTGSDEWATKGRLVERLHNHLALFGDFDRMRMVPVVCGLYDALIDSDLVPAADRPYYRAQMAYLAYTQADPATWSIERGYCSGNPNMSVSNLMNQGLLAALLRDHPEAANWAEPAIRRFDMWMAKDVGPNGEWGESHHYVHVSNFPLLAFVVAAKRAGFHDFLAGGKYQQMLLYIAKMVYTAPDPQWENRRVTAPMGRRPSGYHWGLTGMAARATAESDPEFSRAMQFVWTGTGCSRVNADAKWAGFEYVYPDPEVPAANPNWGSERFPWWGAVLRHGYGTDHEHYLNLLVPNGPVFDLVGASTGSVVKYFAAGVPVGGTFAGSYDMKPNVACRHELLQNRVVPARVWAEAEYYKTFGREGKAVIAAWAALPRADYVRATVPMTKPAELWHHVTGMQVPRDLPDWPPVDRPATGPVDWDRQLLSIKAADPAGFSYLVFRDTVRGGQPSLWQFWTLTNGFGDPAAGPEIQPFRELTGNRFTARGQYGRDVDYFVAAPTDTPRYTLRYGYTQLGTKVQEYQDLLQLRLPEDGHYLVVLATRPHDAAPASCRTLADGHVVEVGTDLVFLAAAPTAATTDTVSFRGTAAVVQQRDDERVLSLAAPGEIVTADGYGLAAEGPAELRLGATVTVSTGDATEALEVEVTLAGQRRRLTVPAGEVVRP